MKAKHFRTSALGNKYNTSSLTRKEQTAYSYKSHGAESILMVLSHFCVYIANTPSKNLLSKNFITNNCINYILH